MHLQVRAVIVFRVDAEIAGRPRHDLGETIGADGRPCPNRKPAFLPDQRLLRHLRAEAKRTGAKVTVRQLEPGAGEGLCKSILIRMKPPSDRFVDGIKLQRQK